MGDACNLRFDSSETSSDLLCDPLVQHPARLTRTVQFHQSSLMLLLGSALHMHRHRLVGFGRRPEFRNGEIDCGLGLCRSFEVYDARTGFPVPRKTPLAATLHGRPFVPTVCAGDFVFFTENGIPFSGKKTHAECWVMKLYPDGEIVGTNKFEKALVASPVFDGDRMYVRSDSFLTCIGAPPKSP